jgi:hypothetical protein
MFNVAVRAPFAPGVNTTLIVQLAPAASVPVALHPAPDEGRGTAKSSASSPLIVNPLKVTVAVLVFFTVTLNGALVVLTACEPNVKLLGVTVTVAVPDVPVPVNVTVCGLPVALSVKVIAPVRVPVAVGLNVIEKTHGSPSTGMFVHCASVAPAKSPLIVIFVNVTAVPPVFDTVTKCASLLVPTAWLPNVNDVGEIVIDPPVAAVPVPLSVIVVVCGVVLPALVYVTVTVPVSVPVAVGANVTFTVQLDAVPVPVASVAGQVFVSPKFALAAILVIVTVVVPTFVIVTGCAALVVPCAWLPNASVAGFAVTFALDKLPACTNTFESYAKSIASPIASLMW